MEQAARVGIFQHPKRAVRRFFDITDAFADVPTLDHFGSAVAVKRDAKHCLAFPGR